MRELRVGGGQTQMVGDELFDQGTLSAVRPCAVRAENET